MKEVYKTGQGNKLKAPLFNTELQQPTIPTADDIKKGVIPDENLWM